MGAALGPVSNLFGQPDGLDPGRVAPGRHAEQRVRQAGGAHCAQHDQDENDPFYPRPAPPRHVFEDERGTPPRIHARRHSFPYLNPRWIVEADRRCLPEPAPNLSF